MLVSYRVCDRCKAENVKEAMLYHGKLDDNNMVNERTRHGFELCKSCVSSLKAWLTTVYTNTRGR